MAAGIPQAQPTRNLPDAGAFSRSDPARWTKTVDFGWR
jgi:hypothetical protein